MYKVFLGNGTL